MVGLWNYAHSNSGNGSFANPKHLQSLQSLAQCAQAQNGGNQRSNYKPDTPVNETANLVNAEQTVPIWP
jgi:hypothetical protein